MASPQEKIYTLEDIYALPDAVIVYDFEHEKLTNHYSFEDEVPACIFEDLHICIADLLEN